MRPPVVDPSLAASYPHHNDDAFLAPTALSVAPVPLTRLAFIGSCHLTIWGFHRANPSGVPVDVINTNNASRPPPYDPNKHYDFQVAQIALVSLITGKQLAIQTSQAAATYEKLFALACRRMEYQLDILLAWNASHGLLTFVANFLTPQANPVGRLFPRFDLRNPEYFISRLNEHLESNIIRRKNAYILDLDRISASIGRRYIQDDLVYSTYHNTNLDQGQTVTNRMEPLARMGEHFDLLPRHVYPSMVWAELIAMHRVVCQADAVKAVVLDLDDTLWNGISGDIPDVGPWMRTGWPSGLAEALHYLKRRGILLAIISKNDEGRIRDIWNKIFDRNLSLTDFAAVRINWRPKAENMADILAGMNILPRSVVFVDDNPVERSAMKSAYPDMRILGRHPYYLRQTLLWASETQVASVTAESSNRTAMIQRQFEREDRRASMSREEFLQSASPTVSLSVIDGTEHPQFARALELINKTNQFNTTGRRWRHEDCQRFLGNGGRFHVFDVEDNFAGHYGLVGVVLVSGASIEQWVMSCRVLGLGVEEAVMGTITGRIRDEAGGDIQGRLLRTELNFPCRDLFARCGFQEADTIWILPDARAVPVPDHVTVTVTG